MGDVVLENRYVRAIIDDVSGGGGFALTGGQLIDFAPRDGRDELGQVFNYLGEFPRQLAYRTMRLETRPGGVAAVVVEGEDPRTPGLLGRTEYSLGRNDRALTLTTTLINHSAAPVDVGLGDAIQWAAAEHWAPGRGFVLRGSYEGPYLAGIGDETAYAYVAPRPISGPNGGNWSNPVQERTTIAPGATVTYTRRIGVARGGDVSTAVSVTGFLPLRQWVRVRVLDARNGAPLASVRVALRDVQGAPAAMGSTDERGVARVAAPPGRYSVEPWAPGRALLSEDGITQAALPTLTLEEGREARVDIRLGPPSTLAVRVRERDALANTPERAVPARVLVHGIGGTPDPMFGPIGRAGGARNAFIVPASGTLEVPLAPGRYRVVATRGPERTLAEREVEVPAAGHVEAELVLERVIDTRGYLCGDFHTHQAPSLDSPVSLRERVRAAAAEGLEVLASTDHNVVSDLEPAARDEGLAGDLLTLPGDELSTDVALRPSGHWNLFPLAYRADAALGGAPSLFELDPAALVRRVREIAPGAIVQVNHPRSGMLTGAFDLAGFERASARATRMPLEPTFDAIEVWNGRYQSQAETVMLDWIALLRTGARITATANSDSHAIVTQEVGYPRTCFRAPGDDVAWVQPADVVRALRETRDVVLTDGPFVRVESPDGQSAIGRTLLPGPDGAVSLRVRVESPRWSAAEVLEVVYADGRIEPVPVTWREEGPVVRGEAQLRVPAAEGFVLFRARGSQRIPVLVGEPPMTPLAMTNPVYFAPARRP